MTTVVDVEGNCGGQFPDRLPALCHRVQPHKVQLSLPPHAAHAGTDIDANLARRGPACRAQKPDPALPAEWVAQQIVECCGWDREPPRFLIRDRDSRYGSLFDRRLRSLGISQIRTPFRVPQANSIAERWVRSVRQECLDHTFILSLASASIDRPTGSLRADPEVTRSSERRSGRSARPWRAASHLSVSCMTSRI